MKVLVTGSHFTPAQAVIEELKEMAGAEIVYVGRKYTREGDKTPSVESQVLPGLGVKFIHLTSGRLQRSFTIHTIPSLLKVPFGFAQSFYLLLQEKPDVVLSFGGYISVPVVISAWLLSVPVIVHEQTLVSGLANEINALFASKIAVSFEQAELFKGTRATLTGNPIRKELLRSTSDKQKLSDDYEKVLEISKRKKLPLVIVMGGNQGSHIINQTVGESLEDLLKITCIVHQTGDSKFHDFENLSQKQQTLCQKENYLPKKWIGSEDLGILLNHADLVISRAGINTLLEMAYFAVPTLVIPIPYLHKDEQNKNAQFFNKLGLSQTIFQKDLTSKKLFETVKEVLSDLVQLKVKAKSASTIVIPDAAKRLALETLLLTKTAC
ncbi:MAG: UDP-N-acetylglucosamine--N-acetylmuramyl-(pentapeptide) pyrophosphoryl-undecaprenol N-acetylglucosamine transferase [Patescibacteria group bacterium]|nr:UDP-N-acetylglucosamine--N-acetylmuramyl-(pentapeptide) pyrophosphoryl-undecaprenol N-acetylglucosamine transferase [Patescibacteria group bacterium]